MNGTTRDVLHRIPRWTESQLTRKLRQINYHLQLISQSIGIVADEAKETSEWDPKTNQ